MAGKDEGHQTCEKQETADADRTVHHSRELKLITIRRTGLKITIRVMVLEVTETFARPRKSFVRGLSVNTPVRGYQYIS